eukprot:566426_1
MAMDVISIIILFFNPCLYWKTDQLQSVNELSFGKFSHFSGDEFSFYIVPRLLSWGSIPIQFGSVPTFTISTVDEADEHEEMMERYSCEGNAANTYPITDTFNMVFTVRNDSSDVYLELNDLSQITHCIFCPTIWRQKFPT